MNFPSVRAVFPTLRFAAYVVTRTAAGPGRPRRPDQGAAMDSIVSIKGHGGCYRYEVLPHQRSHGGDSTPGSHSIR